ncbi:hypothetical protein A3A39_01910 [Candidatus Kaiserbacteria bacterium RIFCSPLOWO2_01_FULL_54_13]|uniref:Uncharacterized protein n=1 Tax=Candidatus Kaiserbacteria bacterium RIFCSPLOWO2_01_FULL_54_13 TaxID=1798512 RepID=A0A1F6F0A9_9BACT|nr:MAG: hypothetical protein A3A39_01910 [Candidatus Kaiserbacteria bacterium RIFCSPLOWO2_01_FULL_54_13]
MSEDMKQVLRERAERRARENELVEKGWLSTGDVPYSIERRFPRAKSGIVVSKIRVLLQQALEGEDDAYRAANIVRVEIKTFISPDLALKIEEKVKEFYDNLK